MSRLHFIDTHAQHSMRQNMRRNIWKWIFFFFSCVLASTLLPIHFAMLPLYYVLGLPHCRFPWTYPSNCSSAYFPTFMRGSMFQTGHLRAARSCTCLPDDPFSLSLKSCLRLSIHNAHLALFKKLARMIATEPSPVTGH